MANTSLTPTTLTAMVGLSVGSGLAKVANNGITITYLGNIASTDVALNPTWFSNAQIAQAATTLSSLTTLSNQLWASNSAGFVQILGRVQGHVKSAIQLHATAATISSTNFNDLGSGVTSMSSIADQGLSSVVGNCISVSTVISQMGPMFSLNDPSSIGTAGGFAEVLTNKKLANKVGLTNELIKNGVDVSDLRNPMFEERILQVMSTITDRVMLAKIITILGLAPFKTPTKLSDFLDTNIMVNPQLIPGITANLVVIGQKLTDMGASFPNLTVATSTLRNISKPTVSSLDSGTPSLSAMVTGFGGTITSMTGTGTGANNLPTIRDFVQVVSGCSELAVIAANPNVSVAAMQALSAKIVLANTLFGVAGINLAYPPTVSNPGTLGFATGLHALGADTTSANVVHILNDMATNNKYGEAIKASLIEGKNISLFSAGGIKPLRF